MKIMQEKLDVMLNQHELWLDSGTRKGKQINLTAADLRSALFDYSDDKVIKFNVYPSSKI